MAPSVTVELNGYMHKSSEEVPEYRKPHGTPEAFSPYQGWLPIQFHSSEQEKGFSLAVIGMTIPAIEESLRTASASPGGEFSFPYPPEVQKAICRSLSWGDSTLRIRLSVSQATNILNAVRNILLDWTMEMEKQGILGTDLSFTQQERSTSAEVTAQTVTYFHIGQVGALVQRAEQSVVQGGIDSTLNLTQDAREALKAVTGAVLSNQELGDTQKNELLEQLAFLSEQSAVAAKDRKPGMIKATLGALTQAAGTVSAMSGAWQAAEPILKNVFGP
jgi:hypothetical protein